MAGVPKNVKIEAERGVTIVLDGVTMKQKKDKKLEIMKYKRKVWVINPVTRKKGNDKTYNRDKEKERFRRELREME